tara:strand:- start:587 stop:814 length:228 start_codon:yes stop_codon:yes gene_type:complete
MYKAMVKESQKLWGKVASENGWSMNGRGCTIWIDNDNEVLDSVYNQEDNKESYIIQVTEFDYEGFYETEVLIKTI